MNFSRNKTKIPEIPATGYNHLFCIGKKAGNYCNNPLEKNKVKCQEHTKIQPLPTGCVKEMKKRNDIIIYCNKEKLENSELCEKHVPKEFKTCTNCKIEKKFELFPKNRNVCQECRSNKNKLSVKKVKETCKSKICKDCEEEKDISKFDGCSLACNTCIYNKKKLKALPKEEVRIKFENTKKECFICLETKNITDFSIHTNTYRNQCKKCINVFKYYENYRKKENGRRTNRVQKTQCRNS